MFYKEFKAKSGKAEFQAQSSVWRDDDDDDDDDDNDDDT